MLRRVDPVRTDVSEDSIASFIRVKIMGELRKTLAVTSNRRTLRRNNEGLGRKRTRFYPPPQNGFHIRSGLYETISGNKYNKFIFVKPQLGFNTVAVIQQYNRQITHKQNTNKIQNHNNK
jgi:hypothetical protein